MTEANDPLPDEELVRAVQRGDTAAFGILMSRYEARLSRYARKFLLEVEDTKDLVQDIFLKAYQNIQGFDTTRRFSPWIYRIAHNEFINAGKKREHAGMVNVDFDLFFPHPIAAETANKEAELRELKETLEKHLGELALKYREPLILYYMQDLSYEEISEVLEIPPGTVGVRLSRGKALLRERLQHLNV